MSIFQTLISILLMRSGPQDMPYSSRLLQLFILLYIASGVLAFQSTIDTGIALANMIADVMVILFYTHIVLTALNRKPRFMQTAASLLGVGIMFHLLAWPLLLQAEMIDGEQVISASASLFILMLLSWSLMVNASIFKQAIESSLISAILLSFALFFISLTVSKYLLPQAGQV